MLRTIVGGMLSIIGVMILFIVLLSVDSTLFANASDVGGINVSAIFDSLRRFWWMVPSLLLGVILIGIITAATNILK